jgi:hypothetical protein
MSMNDESEYQWPVYERRFIHDAIARGIAVIDIRFYKEFICLNEIPNQRQIIESRIHTDVHNWINKYIKDELIDTTIKK